jgi:mRNA interferase RelE/StbE
MKTIRYAPPALKALKHHGNMAKRIQAAVQEYAGGAHRNNVTALVGSNYLRLRVSNFRVLFEETDTEIVVYDLGPRGNIYD